MLPVRGQKKSFAITSLSYLTLTYRFGDQSMPMLHAHLWVEEIYYCKGTSNGRPHPLLSVSVVVRTDKRGLQRASAKGHLSARTSELDQTWPKFGPGLGRPRTLLVSAPGPRTSPAGRPGPTCQRPWTVGLVLLNRVDGRTSLSSPATPKP